MLYNDVCEQTESNPLLINNEFYDDLKDEWYTRKDHPIALLRKENEIRIPWILKTIKEKFEGPVNALDIGCGGGFLTNALAEEGHKTSGIDLSSTSLQVAKKFDKTNSVDYKLASAYDLPYQDNQFSAICAMDVIEHVEDPNKLISEASRCLKPGGLFFYHTFNRNPLSFIFIIKGVEWTVKNTPKNLHVYPLFIRPKELEKHLNSYNLSSIYTSGFGPKLISRAFLQMLFTRVVPDNFEFAFTKSQLMGYCGYALKKRKYD
jgi:2-polyprenyl-6-hydroxyphenyl methylase/3-demethylubiquinone-9 3-methyltransferase